MSANSGSGGVRNLRAMFENKASDHSTSPPSRGRSPNPSEISNSSRPVSKVRASFVAVERPGENGGAPILGLRRASEVSSLGEIKENTVADTTGPERMSVATATPIKAETAGPPTNAACRENGTIEGGLGNILKGSAFIDNTPPKDISESKKLGDALVSAQAQEKPPRASPGAKDESQAAAMVQKLQAAEGSKPSPPPTATLQATKIAQPVKAPPTRQVITKQPPKSPMTSKPAPKTPTSPVAHIRGGPAKIKGVMESAKQAQQGREAMAKRSAQKTEKPQLAAPKVDTQPKAKQVSETAKKDRTPTSPQTSRSPMVVKPKSPTKPAKLPAGLTAPTASSAAKTDAHQSPTETDFRKSVAKKTSTLSIRQPRVSTSSAASTLAKKASRASLTNGHDRPISRVSTNKPDEDFLARMMRPTASSAQKVHEKIVHSSPPRARATSVNKTKDYKQKAPPKMHLEAPQESGGENKENIHGHDESISPEAAATSPLQSVKETPLDNTADTETLSPEVTGGLVGEQVDGETADA